MKYFKIILVISFLFIGFNSVSAQDFERSVKIATAEVPSKVKKTLKDYSGYKIEAQASYVKERGKGTIYAFTVQRKHSSYVLLINKKGKVVGIREGERENR